MINFKGRFEACETLLIGLAAFRSWVGSIDETQLRSRVTWPIRAASLTDYPYVNLSPGRAVVRNMTNGFDSSANFQPGGSFQLRVWDRDSDAANPQDGFNDFDERFTALLSELVVASHSGPLILTNFEGDEPVIVHSHDNAYLLGEDAEGDAVWMGSISIDWGLA